MTSGASAAAAATRPSRASVIPHRVPSRSIRVINTELANSESAAQAVKTTSSIGEEVTGRLLADGRERATRRPDFPALRGSL